MREKLKILFVLILVSIFAVVAKAQNLEADRDNALIRVSVSDFSGEPRANEIIVFSNSDTLIEFVSDKAGEFSGLLSKGYVWYISYRALVDDMQYDSIDIPSVEGFFEIDISIQYEIPQTIILRNVHFDTAKSSLKRESFSELNKLAGVMLEKSALVIEIAGHTDNVGSEEYNMTLSYDRAEAVKSYLVGRGVDGRRIYARGYGFEQPLASNESEEGRAKNRRTEVRIIAGE